jgi:hypothetical protein
MIIEDKIAPSFHYTVECVKPDGSVRWADEFDNLVTTEGKNDLLTNYFKGVGYSGAFFCGLINDTTYTEIVAGDTAASHAGWTESADYSEATRPAVTWGVAAAGSLATSAASLFTLTADDTIKGAFVSTSDVKSGGAGVLYSAGLFTTGDRAVLIGDIVNVSITMSA